MSGKKARPASAKRPQTRALRQLKRWKLEEAKARFSEVVRLAKSQGPQLVTIRGKETAVILSAVEFERLVPRVKKRPLVEFLESLHLNEIPLGRESDPGREVVL